MQDVPLYHLDAFTGSVFAGNPAAVCPLDAWLDDETLQLIAAENNLSETAFFLTSGVGDTLPLRWFTPLTEVDLCGHATLASAYVLMRILEPERRRAVFSTRSGLLTVTPNGESRFTLDFPSRTFQPVREPRVGAALGREPVELYSSSENYLALYATSEEVSHLQPDMAALSELAAQGTIVSAPAERGGFDFVSRYFAPAAGIPEDPVTGSSHCTLAPYWAERLGKTKLVARQVSRRGGELVCELRGDRVLLTGEVVLFAEGTAHL